jgi:hypothetical protein
MTMSLTSPAPSYCDDRYVVISDPQPGTIVELARGSQLAVRFRRCLGPSRWHVAGLPGHLLVLADAGHEFQFLVFGSDDGSAPLRFERRHPEREMSHEVCEVLVVPVPEGAVSGAVSGARGRTSRPASRRSA